MRRLVLHAVALLTVALAGSALAQPSEDIIGVTFDPQGYLDCDTPMTYSVVTVYLVARDISEETGISGWEGSFVTDPATFSGGVSIELNNGGLNALSDPEYDVTFPDAVPRTSSITLATWSTFYLGGVIKFGVGPAHPGHFANDPGPGYAAGNNPEKLKRLHVRCSWGDAAPVDTYYVAVLGNGCPLNGGPAPCSTAIEGSTWGAVKQMYR